MPIDLPELPDIQPPKDLPGFPERFLPLDLPKLESLPELLPTDSKVVIGMIGWAAEAIPSGESRYCHFPTGNADERFSGGRVWERIKVNAVDDIRPYSQVILVDDKRNVIENVQMSLIKETVLVNSKKNILNGKTETTKSYDTAGFNKITGIVKADQNLYVYVDQSMDNTNWDETTTVLNSESNRTFSVEIVAPYCRIRTTNLSGDDTSYCRRFIQLSAGF